MIVRFDGYPDDEENTHSVPYSGGWVTFINGQADVDQALLDEWQAAGYKISPLPVPSSSPPAKTRKAR